MITIDFYEKEKPQGLDAICQLGNTLISMQIELLIFEHEIDIANNGVDPNYPGNKEFKQRNVKM